MASERPFPSALACVAGGILAVICIAAVGVYSGTGFDDWIARMSNIGLRGVAFLMPLSLLFILANAERWIFVLKATHAAPDTELDRSYAIGATSLGHVLVHLLPVQFAALAARLIMLRVVGSAGWRSVVGTTVIEQAVDLMMALCGLGAFLAFYGTNGSFAAFAFAFAAGIAASVVAGLAMLRNAGALASVVAKLPRAEIASAFLARMQERLNREALVEPLPFLMLWVLSLVRFSLFLSVYVLAAFLAGLGPYAPYMLVVMPVVQLCNVFPLVPGNIGVVEGAMAGLLVVLGVPPGIAGSFSLVARPAVLAANVMVAAPALSGVWFYRWRRRKLGGV